MEVYCEFYISLQIMAMQNHSSLFLLNISIPLSLKKGEKIVCCYMTSVSIFTQTLWNTWTLTVIALSGSTLRLSLSELYSYAVRDIQSFVH